MAKLEPMEATVRIHFVWWPLVAVYWLTCIAAGLSVGLLLAAVL